MRGGEGGRGKEPESQFQRKIQKIENCLKYEAIRARVSLTKICFVTAVIIHKMPSLQKFVMISPENVGRFFLNLVSFWLINCSSQISFITATFVPNPHTKIEQICRFESSAFTYPFWAFTHSNCKLEDDVLTSCEIIYAKSDYRGGDDW